MKIDFFFFEKKNSVLQLPSDVTQEIQDEFKRRRNKKKEKK